MYNSQFIYQSLRQRNATLYIKFLHYSDVILRTMGSQITSLTVVYSTIYSGADKKKSKLHVTGLCARNSPVTGEFPAQRASYAENVSIWWRHHISTSLPLGLARNVFLYKKYPVYLFLWEVIRMQRSWLVIAITNVFYWITRQYILSVPRNIYRE